MTSFKKISNIFYWLSILISVSNTILILFNNWGNLLDGKGIGSFSVLWIFIYVIISFLLWAISFFFDKNKKRGAWYFISILIPVGIVIFIPAHFFVE